MNDVVNKEFKTLINQGWDELSSYLNRKIYNQNTFIKKITQDFYDRICEGNLEIAFVGDVNTGKSTLINALLGNDYSSVNIIPETSCVVKFKSSIISYIKIKFYTICEWRELLEGLSEITKKELENNPIQKQWIGHETIYIEIVEDDIKNELLHYGSSCCECSKYVKDIEVGITRNFIKLPSRVVFVDTPGLADISELRSEVTKRYLQHANIVFFTVLASMVSQNEFENLKRVFASIPQAKERVYLVANCWDKLNNPLEDWHEQKKWLINYLSDATYFGSTQLASEHILYAAAYVYLLLSRYPKINRKEIKALRRFALCLNCLPDSEDFDQETFKFLNDIDDISKIWSIIQNLADNSLSNIIYLGIEERSKQIMQYLVQQKTTDKSKFTFAYDAAFKQTDKLLQETRMKIHCDESLRNYDQNLLITLQRAREL